MARYTDLTKKEISRFAESYSIGDVKEFKALGGGYTNSSFLLQTLSAKYILTICEDKSWEEIESLTNLLKHLEIHNFNTTRVIMNVHQSYLDEYDGRPVYVKKYLDGQNVEKPSSNLISEIGHSIAQLHKIAAPDYLPTNFPYGLDYFNEIINSDISNPFIKWLEDKLLLLRQLLVFDLPNSLVHGDIFSDNMIQKNGRLVAIIDFEESSFYPCVFDLGMAIVGIFADYDFVDLGKAQILISAYQEVRELTRSEKIQLRLYCVYGAVATAFWRFRQYHIRHPTPKNFEKHEQMVKIADSLTKISIREFSDAVYK